MAQRIQVPGKGILEFPDGMTQEQMSAAIYNNFPDLKPETPQAQKPEGPGFLDRFIGAAGLLAPMAKNKQTAQLGESALRGGAQPLVNIGAGTGNAISHALGQNAPDINVDLIKNAPDQGIAKAAEIGSSFALPILKPLQYAKDVGKLAKLGKTATSLGDLGLTGATYAGLETLGNGRGDSLVPNVLGGALIPIGLHGAITAPLTAGKALAKGIVGGIDKASKRAGSEVKTPEQLAQMLPSLKDVPVPIQNATNAGYLRNITSELGALPFAGVVNPAQTAVNKTDELANALYHSVGGHVTPEEANPMIHKALNQAEEDVSTNNSKLYQDLATEGEKAGVKGSIQNIQEEAKNILQNYNNTAIKEAHPLHEETFLRSLLGSLEKGFLPDMEKEYMLGSDAPVAGLMDMVRVQQGIGKYLGRVKNKEGKEAATAVAKQLYGLAGKDLDQVIEASKNDRLKGMLTKAKEDYKTNVLPYRETDIKKRLLETETANVADTLLNPKNKGSVILSHLPPVVRNIVLSQALKPAVEANIENSAFNTTPHKLLTKFKELKKKNPTAFNELVHPDVQKSFQSLENLHEATKGLRTMAKKPETGVQVKPILYGAGLEAATHGIGAIAGLTNPASYLLGPAIAYGNRELQALLRNPKLLEAYAAGKGAKRKNAIEEIFGGKKSRALKGAAKTLSNPGLIANILANNPGEG